MELLRDADIDPSPLAGKRVAILGYGNQGRAQALNLHDSGIDVVVGLRGGSGSLIEAEPAGLETALVEEAVRSADVVMMLAPDEIHGALYREVEPHVVYARSGPQLRESFFVLPEEPNRVRNLTRQTGPRSATYVNPETRGVETLPLRS